MPKKYDIFDLLDLPKSISTAIENKRKSEKLKYEDINSPILDYILQQGIVNKDNTPNIKINDNRNIDSTKKFDYTVNTGTIKRLVTGAKSKGLNPSTVLAIALQETGIDDLNPLYNNELAININAVEKSNNWDMNYHQINNSLDYLKQKMSYAKKLGKTSDADTIQAWNGYGKIKGFDDTEADSVVPIYGETGTINMNTNPVYGKRIIDLRENVIKQNKNIMNIINDNNTTPMKKYALGSPNAAPNGELEGGEVIEAPNAPIGTQIQGPKHGQGGVSANIPQGTEIYSDRLKIGDKTIAERKAARDKRLLLFAKVFDKDKADLINKKTMDRVKQANDFQDEKDLVFQEAAKNMIINTAKNSLKQFGLGDDGLNDDELPEYSLGTMGFDNINPEWNKQMAILLGREGAGETIPLMASKPLIPDLKGLNIPEQVGTEMPTDPIGMGFTAGDIIGTVGTAVGGVSQMLNTIQNAKATKPVVNRYAGFNEKALQVNAEYQDQIGYNKQTAETDTNRDLQVAENTARARLRNSASSIGTLRALDVATDVSSNDAKVKATNQLESVFGQQKAQTIAQKVGLLSQQDQMEMAGATAADEANAANLDNFYSNFSANIAGLTQDIQSLGKNINSAKSRNDFLKLLPQTNPWGIGFNQNMEAYINPDSGSPAYMPRSTVGKKTTKSK